MSTRSRRRARRAAVCFLLGLLTAVAVSWVAEFGADERDTRILPGIKEPWLFEPPSEWPAGSRGREESRGYARSLRRASAALAGSVRTNYRQLEVRVGFPVRCMLYRESRVYRQNEVSVGDGLAWIDRGIRLGEGAPGARRLPVRPIWAGLAINSAFYAVVWWLGFWGVRAVMHNRRFRRGMCPTCGEDLGWDYSGGCPACR